MSDSPVSNISMRYIYLGIDDYQKSANNLFLTAFHETTLNDSILARISLKNSFNLEMAENNYNLITEPRKYFGPVDIQNIFSSLNTGNGDVAYYTVQLCYGQPTFIIINFIIP